MDWRLNWKKAGSSTTTSIIPVQVQQETWADRVNSASKWYHKALETIISILATFVFMGILFSPLLPVFFLVDRFIHLFVRGRKTYDIGPVGQCFAVIGCVFWPTFLWSAYDAGFLNLILETLWKNDHGIQSNSILTFIGTVYFIKVFQYNPYWPLNDKEDFLLTSFSLSFIMFTIVRYRTQHDIFKDSDSIKEGLKWTSIVSFLLTIYNFITLVTYIVVCFLKSIELSFLKCPVWVKNLKEFTVFWKSEIVYWVNGLKDSIDYILGSLLLLFAWERFCLPLFSEPERIRKFGFWTCVSLFIWSILWLIKTYVILSWEAHSISKYNQRLGSKIVNGSKQLYFLIIFGEDQSRSNLTYREREQFRHYLLYVEKNTFTMYRKQQMVKHLLEFKNIFGQRKVISHIIDRLKEAIRNIEVPRERDETKKLNIYLTQIISEDDQKCFNEQLEKDGFGDSKFQNITFQGLQNWLEKARNNYLRIANTLSRQQEIVDCLDKIMTFVVLLASIVTWLHLTGTSTTNVILAIVSPFVIGNFMFREIWNSMITGIMFVYFMHPFDVGDLCIVHDEMMEVKSVGIWRTTFEKVDTQEEVIYSNSDLSNKKIINHKTYFDWNDYKELNVGSLEAEKVKNLKRKIENYLSDKSKFTKTSVEVLTTGDDIKIAAKFRHNPINLKNNSYYECLIQKRQLRSEFVLHVQSFLDKHKDPPNDKTGDEFLHKELHVPAIVMKDLDKCINVKGDGNCGFRCVSHAYNQGDDEEQWSFIRKELLTEIKGHRDDYKKIYGHLQEGSSEKDKLVDRAINRIDKPDQGPAIEEKWMEMDDLYAVATRFNYAVVFYVKHKIKSSSDKKEGLIGCSTILPLRAEVGVIKPEAELAIALVGNNHYIRLLMKGDDYPLPPIESRWFQTKDKSVEGWENFYSNRLDRWKKEITTND